MNVCGAREKNSRAEFFNQEQAAFGTLSAPFGRVR
jgi:hypothetical protein